MTTYTDVFGNASLPPSDYSYAAIAIVAADVAYFWPEVATTPILAKLNDVTPDAAARSLLLPDARQVATGRDLLFRNLGADSFEVKDSAGNSLTVVAPGTARYLYLTSNSTAAGVWAVLTLGTGTSAADASALAGLGLVAASGVLTQEHDVVEVSAASTAIATTNRAQTVVHTGGVATIAFLSAATAGNGYFVMLRNAGTGVVTLDPASAELIDGGTTAVLNPGESLIAVCDGAEWYTVGYGRSTEYQFTQLVLDVSAGGTFVLTSTQAANKLFKFVGTPISAVTIQVPAVVSVYYIQCAYSGGEALTVKVSGGTGVSLGGSDRVIAYCDSVDVVSAVTAAVSTSISIVDGSAANPSIFFSADSDTGLFRAGPNAAGVAAGGVEVARFGPTNSIVSKVTLTAPATGATLTLADGKTLTVSNTLTLAATDGASLAIGTGGTLGTAAYTATTAYQAAGTVAAHAVLQTGVHGISVTAAKTLSATNSLTLSGTDGTTMTFPTTSATLARTDAANTFTGVQTMTSAALTTPVLTNPSYSGATANGGTVTTIDINGGTIDGTTIGGASAAAGTFTAVTVAGVATTPTLVIRKTADESKNNTTAVGADTHLVLSVAANEEWVVEYKLFYDTNPNPTGFRFQITAPVGATGVVSGAYVGNLSNESDFAGGTVNGGGLIFNWTNSSTVSITIRAHVINGATPGNVTLDWAQGTAVVQNTTLQRGSWLTASRVA